VKRRLLLRLRSGRALLGKGTYTPTLADRLAGSPILEAGLRREVDRGHVWCDFVLSPRSGSALGRREGVGAWFLAGLAVFGCLLTGFGLGVCGRHACATHTNNIIRGELIHGSSW
jgi:hypothetical protein